MPTRAPTNDGRFPPRAARSAVALAVLWSVAGCSSTKPTPAASPEPVLQCSAPDATCDGEWHSDWDGDRCRCRALEAAELRTLGTSFELALNGFNHAPRVPLSTAGLFFDVMGLRAPICGVETASWSFTPGATGRAVACGTNWELGGPEIIHLDGTLDFRLSRGVAYRLCGEFTGRIGSPRAARAPSPEEAKMEALLRRRAEAPPSAASPGALPAAPEAVAVGEPKQTPSDEARRVPEEPLVPVESLPAEEPPPVDEPPSVVFRSQPSPAAPFDLTIAVRDNNWEAITVAGGSPNKTAFWRTGAYPEATVAEAVVQGFGRPLEGLLDSLAVEKVACSPSGSADGTFLVDTEPFELRLLAVRERPCDAQGDLATVRVAWGALLPPTQVELRAFFLDDVPSDSKQQLLPETKARGPFFRMFRGLLSHSTSAAPAPLRELAPCSAASQVDFQIAVEGFFDDQGSRRVRVYLNWAPSCMDVDFGCTLDARVP